MNSLCLELEPLTIKIEDKFISSVMMFVTALKETLKVDKGIEVKRKKSSAGEISLETFQWQNQIIWPSGGGIFINQIMLSPFKICISFTTFADSSSKLFSSTIFKAIGCAATNLDDAEIILNGLELFNCFDSPYGISMKLLSHYKQSIAISVFKILGSLNLIGNPVGLFNSIGTGFSDLVEKPREGWVKGPLEAGFGIITGSVSLVKNTIAGIFNSVSKMSGSVGSGLATLSFV